MTKRQKYFWEQGYDRGRAIADQVDVPEPGQEGEGHTLDTNEVDSTAAAYDYMLGVAWEVEENDREFSPFEFQAKELNEYADWMERRGYDSMSGWEAFEDGIMNGIKEVLATRLIGYSDEDFQA